MSATTRWLSTRLRDRLAISLGVGANTPVDLDRPELLVELVPNVYANHSHVLRTTQNS